jgi:UDP-galactopyranose mutase
MRDYQGTAVINYADNDVGYTRVIEFAHFRPETQSARGTVVVREYPRLAGQGDDPHYPLNAPEDRALLAQYTDLAREERKAGKVFFGGRLGTYRYLDMHASIGAALSMFRNEIRPLLKAI